MDASNMLKPALARGELRCVGATTLNEYRKHIEKDPALERRFQPILVKEPTVEDTIAILRGLKERYEVHHGVRIKDTAVIAAATLSHRYISDRFLPLVTWSTRPPRACASNWTARPRRRRPERRTIQLEIERQSSRTRRSDHPGAPRKRSTGAGRHPGRMDRMKRHWSAEKESIKKIQALKEEMETLKTEELNAQRRAIWRVLPRSDTAARGTGPTARSGAVRPRRDPEGRQDAQGRGRRRGHRGGCRKLDGHSRRPHDGIGRPEVDPHGGTPGKAGHRAGRGHRRRLQRPAPGARGTAGPQPPDRPFIFMADRRRQDRVGQALAEFMFDSDRPHPDRHVRFMESTRFPTDRRASGLWATTRAAT